MKWTRYADEPRIAAAITRKCPWCTRQVRPCNLSRHVSAAHFHQLSIDEVITLLSIEEERRR